MTRGHGPHDGKLVKTQTSRDCANVRAFESARKVALHTPPPGDVDNMEARTMHSAQYPKNCFVCSGGDQSNMSQCDQNACEQTHVRGNVT